MGVLVTGLVVFLGVHLIPTVPRLRTALRDRLGDTRYRALFSIASLAGLALIVVGWSKSPRGVQLFDPVSAARVAAPIVVAVAAVLFAAANMRTYIRQLVRHPMLLGLLLWSLVHLLANGETRTTVLFGAFLAYALVDLASAVSRHAVKAFTPSLKFDAIAVVAGVAVAFLFAKYHGALFGVPAITAGG